MKISYTRGEPTSNPSLHPTRTRNLVSPEWLTVLRAGSRG